ncbi:general transcription factor II-I repeat domain-containing protein 2B-like [Octopus sinensis]|uniref:General transcription factor II-I repeat domain-containing protein 2B-like n=1 Tax=Octopus sinensis TaxID=2607531 RepID=A0A6P7U826_9MOLL|nr:general transcription factor II-I repeat domain-containing protein 2B-like [Octopus sinensis]
MSHYKVKITGLLQQFETRFEIFREHEKEFTVFRSPHLAANLQLEIIDLKCDSDLKNKFTMVGLDTFYKYLLPKYPNLTALAAKILSMFGSTYLCGQLFSLMNINKTKFRSRLTHTHLKNNCSKTKVLPNKDIIFWNGLLTANIFHTVEHIPHKIPQCYKDLNTKLF